MWLRTVDRSLLLQGWQVSKGELPRQMSQCMKGGVLKRSTLFARPLKGSGTSYFGSLVVNMFFMHQSGRDEMRILKGNIFHKCALSAEAVGKVSKVLQTAIIWPFPRLSSPSKAT